MRYVMENIEAEKVAGEMKRRGIPPRQRLRVTVETLDEAIDALTGGRASEARSRSLPKGAGHLPRRRY